MLTSVLAGVSARRPLSVCLSQDVLSPARYKRFPVLLIGLFLPSRYVSLQLICVCSLPLPDGLLFTGPVQYK